MQSWLVPFLTVATSLLLCAVSLRCETALGEAANTSYSASTGLTIFLTFAALFFFLLAKVSGPGYLPRRWQPSNIR